MPSFLGVIFELGSLFRIFADIHMYIYISRNTICAYSLDFLTRNKKKIPLHENFLSFYFRDFWEWNIFIYVEFHTTTNNFEEKWLFLIGTHFIFVYDIVSMYQKKRPEHRTKFFLLYKSCIYDFLFLLWLFDQIVLLCQAEIVDFEDFWFINGIYGTV